MKNKRDEMYRLLVQSVVDYAIYMLEPDGTVANWNAGAERTKGYKPHEIIGKNFACFYSAEDQARGLTQHGLHIAQGTGRYEVEGWRYRKDGSAFWAYVVIDAVHNDDGQLIGYAKITRDCTEFHEYEQEILLAKERAEQNSTRMASLSGFLDTIIVNIPSCVIVEDLVSQEMLLVNSKAEKLLGIRQAQSRGKKLTDCTTPEVGRYFAQLEATAQRRYYPGRTAAGHLRGRENHSCFGVYHSWQ